MNIFKRIFGFLFKKKSNENAYELSLLQEKNSSINDETKKDFLKSLKSQVISSKKEIEIKERSGDGFGFKKNISC